ncbi:MAG: tetratricopeptide repeat-containing S1 family peptidase [Akkermansiaceae bacterium]
MINRVYVLLIFLCLMGGEVCHGTDKVKMLKQVSNSVVLVKDDGCHGSGMVFSKDGLILTSYRVVNGELPLSVVCMVTNGKVTRKATLDKVKVERMHTEYDLALLKVELPMGYHLIEAVKSEKKVAKGDKSYLIGRGGALGDQDFRIIFSEGEVSKEMVEWGGDGYFESTVEYSVETVGGVIFGSEGEAQGVIALKIGEDEVLGYGVPMGSIKLEDFVEEAYLDQVASEEEGKRLVKLVETWFVKAGKLNGFEKREAELCAEMCLREAIAVLRFDHLIYARLANAFKMNEDDERACQYYEKANELAGEKDAEYLTKLASLYQKRGTKNKAVEMWLKALELENQDTYVAESADAMAAYSREMEKDVRAVYYLNWARSLARGDAAREEERVEILSVAEHSLTEGQRAYIKHKSGGFSKQDLKDFEANDFSAEAVTKSKPMTTKDVIKLRWSKLYEKSMTEAVTLGEAGLEKNLPAKLGVSSSACGGVYLIMTFPDANLIGVFNVPQMKFEKFLPLPSAKTLLTSGENKLLVYDPDGSQFILYDLETFEKLGEADFKLGKVTSIKMNSFISDRGLISWRGEDKVTRLGEIKIPSFEVREFRHETPHVFKDGFRGLEHVELYPNMDFTSVMAVSTVTRNSPFVNLRLRGLTFGEVCVYRLRGKYQVAMDSDVIISGDGQIYNADGDEVGVVGGKDFSKFQPVLGANMMVSFSDDFINVYDVATREVVHKIGLAQEGVDSSETRSWGEDGILLGASALLNRVVMLNADKESIRVLPLNGKVLEEGEIRPGLDMVAGEVFTKLLKYPERSVVRLEDGPEGMKFNFETKVLSWLVPDGHASGNVEVLISIKRPDEDEVFEKLSIFVW